MGGTAGFGPGELCVLAFGEETIPEPVAWAFVEALAEGVVTLLDLALVSRNADGVLAVVELERIRSPTEVAAIEARATGLIGEEDLEQIGATLDPDTSVLVVLVEHTWLRRIRTAVEAASARLVATERVPGSVLDDVAAAAGLSASA